MDIKKLKVIELFAGIGAPRKALQNLNIPHEVVGISEIDPYAIKSYEAIYGSTKNYGDIRNIEVLDEADLITYGFPCQDISISGLNKGITKNTRSGLILEIERLLIKAKENDSLPKYLLMENVKNLISAKHLKHFIEHCYLLNTLGYTTYWQMLNAKDYGIPQNRERIFLISILNDTDENFQFPLEERLKMKLSDLLETKVDEKFYLNDEQVKKIKISTYKSRANCIVTKDIAPTLCARDYKQPICCQIGVYNTPTRKNSSRYRVYDKDYIAPTLLTASGGNTQPHIHINNKVRKLTPLEYWRLMGFDDSDFHKAKQVNSNSQLYKQAGNSIVVKVLERIFENLLIKGG